LEEEARLKSVEKLKKKIRVEEFRKVVPGWKRFLIGYKKVILFVWKLVKGFFKGVFNFFRVLALKKIKYDDDLVKKDDLDKKGVFK